MSFLELPLFLFKRRFQRSASSLLDEEMFIGFQKLVMRSKFGGNSRSAESDNRQVVIFLSSLSSSDFEALRLFAAGIRTNAQNSSFDISQQFCGQRMRDRDDSCLLRLYNPPLAPPGISARYHFVPTLGGILPSS